MADIQNSGVSDEVLLQNHDMAYARTLRNAQRDPGTDKLSPHEMLISAAGGSVAGGVIGVGVAIGMQAMNLINLPQFAGLTSSPVAVGVMAAGAAIGAVAGVLLMKAERNAANEIVTNDKKALEDATQRVLARPNLAAQVEARRETIKQAHADIQATNPDYTAERVGAFAIGAFMGGSR